MICAHTGVHIDKANGIISRRSYEPLRISKADHARCVATSLYSFERLVIFDGANNSSEFTYSALQGEGPAVHVLGNKREAVGGLLWFGALVWRDLNGTLGYENLAHG